MAVSIFVGCCKLALLMAKAIFSLCTFQNMTTWRLAQEATTLWRWKSACPRIPSSFMTACPIQQNIAMQSNGCRSRWQSSLLHLPFKNPWNYWNGIIFLFLQMDYNRSIILTVGCMLSTSLGKNYSDSLWIPNTTLVVQSLGQKLLVLILAVAHVHKAGMFHIRSTYSRKSKHE